MIILEGGISVGKSTQSVAIGKAFNLRLYPEPVETNPYLEDYYKDPVSYGYKMQQWLLTQRYKMHKEAIHHEWTTGQQSIFDRSIYGDMVFAKVNFLMGNMSDRDYHTYCLTRNLMLENCLAPQLCIFLESGVDTLLRNIKERGRPCEQGITREYLFMLECVAEDMLSDLKGRGTEVVVIPFDDFNTDYLMEVLRDRITVG